MLPSAKRAKIARRTQAWYRCINRAAWANERPHVFDPM